MRKRYKIKNQISRQNNNYDKDNNNNNINTNKLMITNNEDNEKDSLNNNRQRNTISNLSKKPVLYRNFRLNKKLELNIKNYQNFDKDIKNLIKEENKNIKYNENRKPKYI